MRLARILMAGFLFCSAVSVRVHAEQDEKQWVRQTVLSNAIRSAAAPELKKMLDAEKPAERPPGAMSEELALELETEIQKDGITIKAYVMRITAEAVSFRPLYYAYKTERARCYTFKLPKDLGDRFHVVKLDDSWVLVDRTELESKASPEDILLNAQVSAGFIGESFKKAIQNIQNDERRERAIKKLQQIKMQLPSRVAF